MIRLLSRTLEGFSKSIQTSKKPKIPIKSSQQRQQLMQQQRISKIYLQFQALPTDPLAIIKQRFMRKKKILSNRRLYIPNKREYMLQLDRYMKEIDEIHEQQMIRQNYTIPKTIGEKIQLQLEFQNIKHWLNFFKNDEFVIKVSAGLFGLFMFIQAWIGDLPADLNNTKDIIASLLSDYSYTIQRYYLFSMPI